MINARSLQHDQRVSRNFPAGMIQNLLCHPNSEQMPLSEVNRQRMTHFQQIGVIVKRHDEHLKQTLTSLLNYLDSHSIEYLLDETVAQAGYRRKDTVSRKTIAKDCDLVMVVGGDGTLLSAARSIVDADVPLLGITIFCNGLA